MANQSAIILKLRKTDTDKQNIFNALTEVKYSTGNTREVATQTGEKSYTATNVIQILFSDSDTETHCETQRALETNLDKEQLESLEQIRKDWDSTLHATSPSWNLTVRRFLPLLFYTTDEQLKHLRTFSPRTAAKYVIALATGGKFANRPVSTQLIKIIEREAKQDPLPPQLALNVTEAQQIWQMRFSTCPKEQETAVLIPLAFLLGQRIGDLAHVLRSQVKKNASGDLTFTILQGKTAARSCDPYTLIAPAQTWVAAVLEFSLTLNPNATLLFPLYDSSFVLNKLKKWTGRNLCQNSVRRGGLQRLARAGTTSDLLQFSRHRSSATLNRYLNWGQENIQALCDMARVQLQVEEKERV